MFKLISVILVVMAICEKVNAQADKPLSLFDIQAYHFRIEVQENTDSIFGYTTISFKQLKFDRKPKKLTLHLKGLNKFGKGMMVQKVVNNRYQSIPFTHKNNIITIELKAGFPMYSEIGVIYKGIPENGMIIGKNKFGDKTWFGDNWPNRAQYWLPIIDHPADKAKVRWEVTPPEGYTVVANGSFVEGSGGALSYQYIEPYDIPMKVAVIGIAKLDKKELFFNDSIPVTNYMYPQTFAKQPNKMDVAIDVLKFMEEKVGKYPYDKLNNVQSTTMFGGMENANNIFYDENTIDSEESNEALIAHEIAHQWFGNTVTEKDFSHLWLSEGFATFYTNYYYEKKYGEAVVKERIEADRRKVAQFLARNKRTVVDNTTDLMSLLNANSYQKGGLFLYALKTKLGELVFDQVIKTYYEKYKFKNAKTDDFRIVAESVSKMDLKPLFTEWLYSTSLPNQAFPITEKKEIRSVRSDEN